MLYDFSKKNVIMRLTCSIGTVAKPELYSAQHPVGRRLRVADRRLASRGSFLGSGLVSAARSLRPGFSLAELMIAVGILGIGMLIIAAAFPVALDQSRQALELSTSQMVFNEAVNNLKTQIKWTELERYIDPNDAAGVLEISSTDNSSRLGPNETTIPPYGIYLLSFDPVPPDPPGAGTQTFFTPATISNAAICAYSVDNTYAWQAVVQKIGSQCYKFWIFVVREPSGAINSNGNFIFILHKYLNQLAYTTGDPANKVSLTLGTISGIREEIPQKGMQFLCGDGNVYTVQEAVRDTNNANQYHMMLDRGGAANLYAAFVAGGKTRKNPVIAVYQTVIGY